MKWSYALLLTIAAAMIASPFFFLAKDFRERHPEGIVYRATYSAAIKSMDPATCGDVSSATIQGNVYEGLYTYHFLKRPVEVVEQLADGMPGISEDGLVYTIRLKPGVLYHRNPCFGPSTDKDHPWATREVVAQDFILAIKRVADYHINTGLAWAFLADRIVGLDAYRQKTKQYKIGDFSRYDLDIEGLRALDDHTLQFTLTDPFPQFIYVLAMNVYAPIPREVVDYWLATADDGRGNRKQIPEHERFPEISRQEQVVGTGPYLLTAWERKWKIKFVRNPEFREEVYPSEGEPGYAGYPGDSALGLLDDAGKRVPFIDEIHFSFIEEEYAQWMMFLSRQTDVGSIPQEAFTSVITPGKDLDGMWKDKGIYLHRASFPVIYWIVFNMEDPLFGGCRELRQAMCLAYDVESKIAVLLEGVGTRALNVIPGTFKGHQEAGPGPYARFDPDAAKVKLAEALEQLKKNNLLENGQLPEIKFDLTNSVYAMRLAEFVRQQFAPLGIRIKPVFNDWPTLQRKVNNKQVQIYTMGWHADYPDAENFLQLFYSGNIDKGTNNSNFRDHVFDSLYEIVRLMQDTPERTAIYARMTRILSEECPVLLLHEPESYTLFSQWTHNVKAHPIGYGFLKYRRIDDIVRGRMTGRSHR